MIDLDVIADGEHTVPLDPVERAIDAIAAGRPVVVVDDEDRENEGDLILAADAVTPELLGFVIRHTSGVVCVSMPAQTLDRLELPPMTAINEDAKSTAFAVSVDARNGITTGISAADRAHTIRTLVDPATTAHDLTRPGHLFPLRAAARGVLQRPGHTEAAVDLARLAGRSAAGVLCEIVNDDGSMMRAPDLRRFADRHDLPMISIAELIRYRRRSASQVERIAVTRLPTADGDFTASAYRDKVTGAEHVALSMGDVSSGDEPVPVRLHSECLTGEVFGSLRCDCGPQLRAALTMVGAAGRGVIVYLRGHEGRGIGLGAKIAAYALQDGGRDTVDANLDLGLPADARDYGTGAHILLDLGVRRISLMTNNPAKLSGIEGFGIEVAGRIPLPVDPHPENLRYLRTKRDRMGHVLPDLGDDGDDMSLADPTERATT